MENSGKHRWEAVFYDRSAPLQFEARSADHADTLADLIGLLYGGVLRLSRVDEQYVRADAGVSATGRPKLSIVPER